MALRECTFEKRIF